MVFLKAIYYILILIEFSYYLLNNSYDINNARYEIALPFLHTIVLILAVTTFVAKDSFDFNKAITLIYCIFLGLRSMLFIYLFIIFGTLIYKAKSILKKFFLIIIPLVILVCLGEYRQPDEFNIIEFSGYSINSKFIAWILAYTTINIDNLLLAYHEDYNSKYFLPVATFGYIFSFFDSGARMEMGRLENELIYVGRLNLGTAFRSFYFDFGVIFGSIICSLVLCFYVRIMKISEIHENYAVLMLSLTPFYLYSVLNFISAPFILIPLLFYYVVYRKNYTTIN